MPIRLDESAERTAERLAAQEALHSHDFIDVPTLALATSQAERVIRSAIGRGDIKVVRLGRSIRIPTRPLRRAWGME